MANPEAVGILQQGVARWNEWRKDKDGPSLDLSGADLRNRDLTGADLRAVNLPGAVLRGTKIGPRSLLWNANLSGADLYGANLCGADLQDVDFSGADLFQTDLRESNLQGADLSTAKGGLLSKQLAGSDLTGAKLPEPLAKLYDSLSSVKEISDSAQKLFLALLAGCLYSWLTIAQTTDVELITNLATTPLPIIQAAIPIVGFYVVAPLILLCMYFYFHFYLQKLWEELGSLPAVFTDGRQLHNRTDPWLLNDLVRSHFVKLKDGRPFLSYFQAWVSVVLAWWLVPITLFAFWLRFLRRHDLFWTIVHALILTLAIVSAIRLYRIANSTLRGEARAVFHLSDLLKRRSTYLRLAFSMAFGALLVAISLGAIFGERGGRLEIRSPRTWVPWLLHRGGYYAHPDLSNADISLKPPNWTGKKDEELDLVKGGNLSGSNLDYAYAPNAFLVKANLDEAHMRNAVLRDADLRQATLDFADLGDADLFGATLQDASLQETELRHANLITARLNRARMDKAYLTNAIMLEAKLTGASLMGADLHQASCSLADFSGVNFSAANLTEADFVSADLQGAKLPGADLTGAKLESANIQYADFRNGMSPIDPLVLHTTRGLTPEMITAAKNWQLAFYEPNMLQQLRLPPDHNQKLQKQMEAEQQAKTTATTPTAPRAKP